jgi:GT2 family glycosyltransferase
LRLLRTQPGLPLQRNAGIRATWQDVVHFIDDDTEPEPAYFGEILRVFDEEGPDVLAVGGRISNLGDRPPVSRADTLFLLDGPEGAVLASGKNVHNWSATERRPTQWLSGCSMSYRREVFDRELFDEGLAGYALGEDIDMSIRVGRHGRLVHEPRARIVHHVSAAERWPDARFFRTEIAHRQRRVARSFAGERMTAFWWSVAGQVVLSFGRAVTRQSRFHLKVGWWTLLETGALLRRRSPVPAPRV